MTLYTDVWRLPGPNGFVRDIARTATGGQHVLAILPRYISDDPEYSDALAAAILNELDSHQRVYPSSANGGLVGALGFAMIDSFEDPPMTVPALITHPDVAGRIFVCNATDLERMHRAELPQFLQRLNDESRPVPASERGTMIFVVSSAQFHRDPASVAMTPHWYWDRVARWDVAAFIAARHPKLAVGVAGEVKLETVIEIARWNFEIADDLSRDWALDGFNASDWVGARLGRHPAISAPRQTVLNRPPDSHQDLWNEGIVESWHGVPEVAPTSFDAQPNSTERLIWRAQARVMLPWLEVRRVRIEQRVRDQLGAQRMSAAVEDFSPRFPGIGIDPSLIELATLARIISARLGRSEERLGRTTRLLVDARNRLSHLRALAGDEIEHLVDQSQWLN